MSTKRKRLGQFYTPPAVARALVEWVVRSPGDRLLDPACGEGEFLALHPHSLGIDIDPANAEAVKRRVPSATVRTGEFFGWARQTAERFEAVAGNPPFIRYQHFAGETRAEALAAAAKAGAQFNALCSSWAPFLVVAASLLKPGGCLAFVVPAEIGHATYAAPLIEWLCGHFEHVGVTAIRDKLFPDLSEDAWLLECRSFGGSTSAIGFCAQEQFSPTPRPPQYRKTITLTRWRAAHGRLRPFLLPDHLLALYRKLAEQGRVVRLGELAHVGIGYVTGSNDFFHLRPSEVQFWNLPERCLRVTVRRAEQLPAVDVDSRVVRQWLAEDEKVLLLDLSGERQLSGPVRSYLSTTDANRARQSYKCRNRDPWYVVPDIRAPDAFLSYMSGRAPVLVANSAHCVCTNSVHAVRLKNGIPVDQLQRGWDHPLCRLSCEIEGHPLGGGLLKLEPREAARITLPLSDLNLPKRAASDLKEALQIMHCWRHYD